MKIVVILKLLFSALTLRLQTTKVRQPLVWKVRDNEGGFESMLTHTRRPTHVDPFHVIRKVMATMMREREHGYSDEAFEFIAMQI